MFIFFFIYKIKWLETLLLNSQVSSFSIKCTRHNVTQQSKRVKTNEGNFAPVVKSHLASGLNSAHSE